MPNLAAHAELIKPAATGASGSFFAGLLLEYLQVTPPIFVAAAFGAIVAVAMLNRVVGWVLFGFTLTARLVSFLTALTGCLAACYSYHLIKPVFGLDLPQTPATMLLAFILVYFLPLLLDVGKNRIEGLKK